MNPRRFHEYINSGEAGMAAPPHKFARLPSAIGLPPVKTRDAPDRRPDANSLGVNLVLGFEQATGRPGI